MAFVSSVKKVVTGILSITGVYHIYSVGQMETGDSYSAVANTKMRLSVFETPRIMLSPQSFSTSYQKPEIQITPLKFQSIYQLHTPTHLAPPAEFQVRPNNYIFTFPQSFMSNFRSTVYKTIKNTPIELLDVLVPLFKKYFLQNKNSAWYKAFKKANILSSKLSTSLKYRISSVSLFFIALIGRAFSQSPRFLSSDATPTEAVEDMIGKKAPPIGDKDSRQQPNVNELIVKSEAAIDVVSIYQQAEDTHSHSQMGIRKEFPPPHDVDINGIFLEVQEKINASLSSTNYLRKHSVDCNFKAAFPWSVDTKINAFTKLQGIIATFDFGTLAQLVLYRRNAREHDRLVLQRFSQPMLNWCWGASRLVKLVAELAIIHAVLVQAQAEVKDLFGSTPQSIYRKQMFLSVMTHAKCSGDPDNWQPFMKVHDNAMERYAATSSAYTKILELVSDQLEVLHSPQSVFGKTNKLFMQVNQAIESNHPDTVKLIYKLSNQIPKYEKQLCRIKEMANGLKTVYFGMASTVDVGSVELARAFRGKFEFLEPQ